jgi:hypothetical protein
MELPLIAPLRQVYPQPSIADVAGETRRLWLASRIPSKIKRGDRVAVATGSRGIANLADIARATLDVLLELGAKPFIVAAMGSHGGGTSAGQRELLAEYGIGEQAFGVPVKTDMTVIELGKNSLGETVYWDKNAFEADAVLTLSRIKAHTDFRGRYESGILKMLVIGLGKRDGAAAHHKFGVRGLRDVLPESGKVILEKTRFLGGLAILENAREETASLQVVERDVLYDVEPRLLDQAKAMMGRLPFNQIDLLIIGEIGKNYSGAGIDPNVVGRLLIECEPEFETPKITRICAFDLSPESHGNGTGVGIADLTTDRLLKAIDPIPFRMNNLTACFLRRSQIPFSFPTDRECMQTGVTTCWQPDVTKVRMAVIPNTLEVAELWVSPPLVEEARKNLHLQIGGEARPLPFDAAGSLEQERLFPHSIRARRRREHP